MPMSSVPRSGLRVGTHRLHDDVSINFQLNRWIGGPAGTPSPTSLGSHLS